MGPGFRYHIATLTGVFLALGLGIIIGSTFVSSAIVDRQTKTLAQLREQYTREIEPRRVESERNARFASALVPWITPGKLTGKRVALIQTGDYPDAVRRIREILESAGLNASSITVIDKSFPTRAQTNLKSILPKLLLTQPELPNDSSALLSAIAAVIARGGANDLQPLQDARLIQLSGDYAAGNDYVILVGGATPENASRAETLDVPLVTMLLSQGKSVLAAEPEAAGVSYTPILRGYDISTVDNADTDIGRLALLLALRAKHGHFGVKPSASDGILPAPPPQLPATDDIRHSPGP